jgi:hypothetical protein
MLQDYNAELLRNSNLNSRMINIFFIIYCLNENINSTNDFSCPNDKSNLPNTFLPIKIAILMFF